MAHGVTPRVAARGAGAARRTRAPRSSSRRPTTACPPTSRAAPRSRTRPDVPLVVDQAWGPHFGFHPDAARERAGARRRRRAHEHAQDRRLADAERDAARRSTATGSTPTRVGRAVRLVRSTSPSSLLLASLDAARRQLAVHGEALLHETLAAAGARARKLREVAGRRAASARSSSAGPASPPTTRCASCSTCAAPAARATRSPTRCARPTTSTPSSRRTRRSSSSSASASARRRSCGGGRRRRDRQAHRAAPGRDGARRPAAGTEHGWPSRRATRSSGTPRPSPSTTPSAGSRASRSPATRRASRRCCPASGSRGDRRLPARARRGAARACTARTTRLRDGLRARRALISARGPRACRRPRRPRTRSAAAHPPPAAPARR